jgi:hypothetical protein
MNFSFKVKLLSIFTFENCCHARFMESLTHKRREIQEKLAEKAIEDAARKKSEELAAAAAAAAAVQQNGSAGHPAVTPVSSNNSFVPKEGIPYSSLNR